VSVNRHHIRTAGCLRRWLLAQLHQEALMQAVDFDDDGQLDWDGFLCAAILMMDTSAKCMEPSILFRAFQAACGMSRQMDTCAIKDAQIKIRALLGRVWSMQKVLPLEDTEVNDEGTPHILARHCSQLQDRLHQLEATVQIVTTVCTAPDPMLPTVER
jgi:hypothetical protein